MAIAYLVITEQQQLLTESLLEMCVNFSLVRQQTTTLLALGQTQNQAIL